MAPKRRPWHRIGFAFQLLGDKPKEFLVTSDNFDDWKKHIAHSKKDGKEIKNIFTQRYSTMMVLSSMLLAAEVNVLYSPSAPVSAVREAMKTSDWGDIRLYLGVVLVVSMVLTLFTIFTTFTAWGSLLAIDDRNIAVFARSSMGRNMTSIPSRLLVAALFAFLTWALIGAAAFLPHVLNYVVLATVILGGFYLVVLYSSFCRLIMHTGAMDGRRSILTDEEMGTMTSSEIDAHLRGLALEGKRKNSSIPLQYDPSFRHE